MPFVKLDFGMVDSTIICEPGDAFKAWIILLLKAGPDGVASITAPVLAKLCDCSLSRMEEILEGYAGPEKHSRTSENGGARIAKVEGGYLILNYEKYRAKDYGSVTRMRRYREKLRHETVTPVTVTQAEAEVDIDKRERRSRATALSPDFGLTPERVAYASQHNVQSVQNVMEAFCNHHRAKGSTMRDWEAAWRTWVLREVRYGKKPYPDNMSNNDRKSDASILDLCKQSGISTHGKSRDELLLALQRVRP